MRRSDDQDHWRLRWSLRHCRAASNIMWRSGASDRREGIWLGLRPDTGATVAADWSGAGGPIRAPAAVRARGRASACGHELECGTDTQREATCVAEFATSAAINSCCGEPTQTKVNRAFWSAIELGSLRDALRHCASRPIGGQC